MIFSSVTFCVFFVFDSIKWEILLTLFLILYNVPLPRNWFAIFQFCTICKNVQAVWLIFPISFLSRLYFGEYLNFLIILWCFQIIYLCFFIILFTNTVQDAEIIILEVYLCRNACFYLLEFHVLPWDFVVGMSMLTSFTIYTLHVRIS